MVCVAADGIEKALSMQNVCEELSRTNRVVERMIDSFPSSVLVLDEKDRIVKYSKKTLHALKLNRKNGIAGKTVFELIKRDSIPDVLEDLK